MPEPRTDYKVNGRIGGLTRAALGTNEQHRKDRAAEGRMRRFLDQIPTEVTDPAERLRRAQLLQRAHMSRIALKSAAARRKPSRAA